MINGDNLYDNPFVLSPLSHHVDHMKDIWDLHLLDLVLV
jgi:hypothetical protein